MLGHKIMTKPLWNEFGRLIQLKHTMYKARKIQIHKNIYPAKVQAQSPQPGARKNDRSCGSDADKQKMRA